VTIDPVAIYASIVATAGLGWQGFTWQADRRVKVRLDFSSSELVNSEDTDPRLFLILYNDGNKPITWTQSGIYLQDGSNQSALIGLGNHVEKGFELPKTVAPGSSEYTAINVYALTAVIDFYKPVVVHARLGSGTIVRSRSKTLFTMPLDTP
jgi:hypothetical protein